MKMSLEKKAKKKKEKKKKGRFITISNQLPHFKKSIKENNTYLGREGDEDMGSCGSGEGDFDIRINTPLKLYSWKPINQSN